MAFQLLDLLQSGMLQDEKRQPSLGVNTALPQVLAPQAAPQGQAFAPPVATPEVKNAGGGLLSTIGLITRLLQGDIGGFASQLENQKLAQQTQQEKVRKAQTEANVAGITKNALGVKKKDLASADKLYDTFLQAGASPEEARTSLNFLQSQQEKAEPSNDELLGPYASQIAQGLDGPMRGAVEALVQSGQGF